VIREDGRAPHFLRFTLIGIASFIDYFKGHLRSEIQYNVPYEVTDPDAGETKKDLT
jgi:hypothetical protein